MGKGLVAVGTSELLLRVTANCPEQVQCQLDQRIGARLIDIDAADARRLITAAIAEIEADLDPEGQKERHQQAHANRGVWVKPIGGLVPSPRAAPDTSGTDTGTDTGTHIRNSARTADRDELLAALLAVPLRNPMTMYVHVPVSTVLDLDNRAGYVEGLGAISAYRARLVRPTAALSRLWVDHRSGLPLGLDPDPPLPPVGEPDWGDPAQVTEAAEAVRERLRSLLGPTTVMQRAEPGRFPSSGLTRFVQARDLSCRGVGCPRAARACDLDHRLEHAKGGLTASWNLDAQSPRCHHGKDDGWTVRRDEDGTTVWISPLGSCYIRRSPWLPPPALGDEVTLPPPRLDRPDGGRSRSDWYAGPAQDLDSRFRDGPRSSPGTPPPDRERRLPPAPDLPPPDPDAPPPR